MNIYLSTIKRYYDMNDKDLLMIILYRFHHYIVLSLSLSLKQSSTEEVQAIYQKVFLQNRDEMIQAIKEEVLEFTEQQISQVLEGTFEQAEQTLSQYLMSSIRNNSL